MSRPSFLYTLAAAVAAHGVVAVASGLAEQAFGFALLLALLSGCAAVALVMIGLRLQQGARQ
ncbi:hypothetical protein [Methylocystis heyeri]|uniref:Uncharacterized protein n=1 Tax=Methylocystis heyeri TaxID=391905 RepID=A0A6B8KJG6_9HYPH|nr:hypothetical protein [Methylocystis heyeri]QGM46713.1 hypothetical protein H2LOC_013980 [Methylocystis heyeri]